MSSLKMILADSTEIDIAEFGHGHIVVLCDGIEDFREVHDELEAGKSRITIEDNGATIAVIDGAAVAGTQTVCNLDGTVTGHFYMSGGAYDNGGDYAEAAKILLGEE